jgi:hypothetical protein
VLLVARVGLPVVVVEYVEGEDDIGRACWGGGRSWMLALRGDSGDGVGGR